LCMIIRCQWVQLGFDHLDNSADEVRWWHVLGWQNFEISSMCYQIFLAGWFVAPSKCFQMLPMFGFLINV
jgi:hypothetical protein